MTAMVLGLLTASAKDSFDSVDTAVKHTAIDILPLDRVLARYGPETKEIRTAAVLLGCAMSVGSAVFLVLEMGGRSTA